jgi:hypothetical protein
MVVENNTRSMQLSTQFTAGQLALIQDVQSLRSRLDAHETKMESITARLDAFGDMREQIFRIFTSMGLNNNHPS